tara:strand:+ start:365 stop:556 length:192 start_codon:yes stop_codon:yes gene_type:complete
MKKCIKTDREWMSHIRREGHRKKSEVSLAEPPWKDREANAGDNSLSLPEINVSLSKENKWTRD